MGAQLSVYATQPKLANVHGLQGFSGIYMVTGLLTRFDPKGYPYLAIELSDNQATISVCCFSPEREMPPIVAFQWVGVQVNYQSIQGFPHFRCEAIDLNPDVMVVNDRVSLLPYKYSCNVSHLSALRYLVNSIRCDALRDTVEMVLVQPEVTLPFLSCPASLNYHHNYRGGLLEHSLEVARLMLMDTSLSQYERDLAVAIALFHDIGKTLTLTPDMTRTALGTLVDHSDLNLEVCGPALKYLSYQYVIKANQVRHAITCSSENSRYGFAANTKLAKLLRRADRLSAEGYFLTNEIN